jgi:glutamyl-tRNA synthetase
LDAVGRAPARFDFAKLGNLNGHYIRITEDDRLVDMVAERLEKMSDHPLSEAHRTRLLRAMPELKLRPKTLAELAANAVFLVQPRPIHVEEKAAKLLAPDARHRLAALLQQLAGTVWQAAALEGCVREFAAENGIRLASVAQPLRAALTGSLASPGIFEVMEVLGREETLGRIADAAVAQHQPDAGVC